jgi:dienelactone hydrolase
MRPSRNPGLPPLSTTTGISPPIPETLKKIGAPILGRFGGQDHGITPDDVDKFEAATEQQGKEIEMKIHDHAGHACENPNNQDGYRPGDDAEAGKRGLSFLAENLKN